MLNQRMNISVPLAAGLAALAIGALVVAVYLFNIAAALVGPGMGDVEPDRVLASYVKKHEEAMQSYAARFEGRSLFYIPPVRQPTRVVTVPDDDTTQQAAPPPPPPPPPTVVTYTGPSPIFAVGDEVWFERPRPKEPQMHLRVGETAHGVTLVSVTLPSLITVEFRGKQFELDLLGDAIPAISTDGTEGGIVRTTADGRSKPTPGIVIVTAQGEVPFDGTDDQPSLTASDVELPNRNARPQPMGSNIAFVLDEPGDDVRDETADPADTGMDEQPADEWHGPPIPDELRAQYVMADAPALENDDTDSVAISTREAPVRVPKVPRDLEEEDEQAGTIDPEAQVEAQSGAQPQPQTDDPSADNPGIPPE